MFAYWFDCKRNKAEWYFTIVGIVILLLLKKIFILIPWFHPAYKAGGPIQSIANMVRAMVNKQIATGNEAFEFKIFTSNKDLGGTLLQTVAFDEWVPYNAQTKVWYSSTDNILPLLQQEIKKEDPAYLFITGIYDWQYNFKPLLFCRGIKKIISVRGMLHPGALTQKGFKKKIYLLLWKILGLHKGNGQWVTVFHATDGDEQKYIEQVFGDPLSVKVAGNFPNVLPLQPVVQKEPGFLKMASIALISPMKNILLVLEALASGHSVVGSGQPDTLFVEYNIYGPVKDKQYWEQCMECIKKLPANIIVKYYGDIAPGSITDALAANHVFILPSKSENFGHAIYEALTAGRPVITSNGTPWNNLQAVKAGMNVSLINSDELVHAIELFAGMEQEELHVWSNGARVYAEKAVDIDSIRRQYAEMFSI